MNKYSNIHKSIDGYVFDSTKEATRYTELKLLLHAGEIKSLQLQPLYELQPAFVDKSGKRYRAITYSPDFSYLERKGNKWISVVEDVKGMLTEVYKIKKKLFLYKYNVDNLGEIDFREI